MKHTNNATASRHPSLLAVPEDFERIRGFAPDTLPGCLIAFLENCGEAMLPLPPVEEKLEGIRLLHVARNALKRISTWALLYQLHGEVRYLERAAIELDTLCGFSSWNPSHFLDTAEMTLTAAIGLDWLGDALPTDLQNRIRQAIRAKGIEPSLDEEAAHNRWISAHNNWNPVCHASLIAGVLVLGEETSSVREQIIERALRHIPRAMDETLPDGIYPEGPTYWEFGTHYTILAIELLRHARRSAKSLHEHPTLFQSAQFHAHMVAPSGDYYNYSDARTRTGFSPVVAWFASNGDLASRYELCRSLPRFLENPDWQPDNDDHRLLAMAALWIPPPGEIADEAHATQLPFRWTGRGPNPIAIVRGGFGNPTHFYFAAKGGRASLSHGHMDAGSFILEDQGVRWALDLGMQEYHSLESKNVAIWDGHQQGDRWRIFRCGPYSHNLLLIDEQLPAVDGQAELVRFEESEDRVEIVFDLKPLFPDAVQSYLRSFTVVGDRVLRVTDRITGARTAEQHHNPVGASLHWRMVTAAAIAIHGNRAKLTQDGKQLHCRVLQPGHFTLRSQPLDPPPYWWDAPNPGISSLDLWTHANAEGNQEISILLSTDLEALESEAG